MSDASAGFVAGCSGECAVFRDLQPGPYFYATQHFGRGRRQGVGISALFDIGQFFAFGIGHQTGMIGGIDFRGFELLKIAVVTLGHRSGRVALGGFVKCGHLVRFFKT